MINVQDFGSGGMLTTANGREHAYPISCPLSPHGHSILLLPQNPVGFSLTYA
jgi:hypothetical protein